MQSGPQGSLEEWGRSLNGLTELKKFRELGTLMYGDPAQGPSIVSRYVTAKHPQQRSAMTHTHTCLDTVSFRLGIWDLQRDKIQILVHEKNQIKFDSLTFL